MNTFDPALATSTQLAIRAVAFFVAALALFEFASENLARLLSNLTLEKEGPPDAA